MMCKRCERIVPRETKYQKLCRECNAYKMKVARDNKNNNFVNRIKQGIEKSKWIREGLAK